MNESRVWAESETAPYSLCKCAGFNTGTSAAAPYLVDQVLL